MFISVLQQLKWLDIFVIILFFRVCYVAIQTGVLVEVFKLFGTVLAVFFSLHYFRTLAEFISTRFLGANGNIAWFDFVSSIALALLGYGIFFAIRLIFCRVITMQTVPALQRWGGFIIGMVRGLLTVGLIVFIMALSPVDYMHKSVKSSFSGCDVVMIADKTYTRLWDNILSKFMTTSHYNRAVSEVAKKLGR
jgi:uncharacterized membrane protein required for colicin V production